MKNTISVRQTAIIACILLFSNKILTLPSLLYEKSKADSLFIMLLMFFVEIFVLFVFFKLKRRYQSETFFEILSQKLGKVVAIIVFSCFFLYFFIKLLINFNFTHMYFKIQVYHDDQDSVFLFVAIVVMITMMARGFRPLARTLEFFYYAILIGFGLCVFISFVNFRQFPIFFDSPIKEIFIGSYRYAFAFGDVLFLFFIMDKVELTRKGEGQILKYVTFAMVTILVGYFLFFSVYQYSIFMHPSAVSDIIVLSYQIFSVGRLEFLAVLIIMNITLFQISLYAYVLAYILRQIFKKLKKNYSIFVVLGLFLSLYVIYFNNLDVIKMCFTGYASIFALVLQLLIPLICLVFTFSKKEQRRQVWENIMKF